jgi:hypothetical protein
VAHEHRLDILRALLARLRGEPTPAGSPALGAPEKAARPALESSVELTFVAPGLAPPAPPARAPRPVVYPWVGWLEFVRGLLVRLGPACAPLVGRATIWRWF